MSWTRRKVGVYPFTLVKTNSLEEFERWYPNGDLSPLMHAVTALDEKKLEVRFYVPEPPDPVTTDYVNTVCHEATHGAAYIFQTIGQELDDGSEEPFAYLTGFIAEFLWS